MMKTKPRILLVEDEPWVRKPITIYLTRQDYQVVEAGSGKEAIQKLANPPDLMILDMLLPDMTGLEVLKRCPQENLPPRIIFMSGYTQGSFPSLPDTLTFTFLKKPFEMKTLVSAVEDLLKR